MPIDMSSLQRMVMDRLQEQTVNPQGQQQQANPQHVSQFQNELELDAGMGAKNAGATQSVSEGGGCNTVNPQAVPGQSPTPGDTILTNMSSPRINDIAGQVMPVADVTGEGASGLVHAQMAMADITLNSGIGVNSVSNSSQGFESLLHSS